MLVSQLRASPPRALLALLMLLLGLLAPERAVARGAAAPVVSVLTMGPGEHPFSRFGHNALLLEWPSAAGERAAHSVVYNFGTFAFDGLQGVRDFMAGEFRYWLSTSTLEETLDFYAGQGRSLSAQELALTPEESMSLARALADNARPEHRYYDYDYYFDNCSTRVRDVLDRQLGGFLQRSITQPGRLSFRQHTLRLVSSDLAVATGLDLALGSATDRKTTRWQELFLPAELHDALANVERTTPQGREPLVRRERTLLVSQRSAVPAKPPDLVLQYGFSGLGLGSLLCGSALLAARFAAARVLVGLLTAALGACTGLLGCVFAYFWVFSEHWATHRNLNLLLAPPFALLLAVFGSGLARGRRVASWRAMRWTTYCLLSAALGALLAGALGLQDCSRTAALMLPLWGAAWFATHWPLRSTSAASTPSPHPTYSMVKPNDAAHP
jgi:hypothetical protein